MLNRASMKYINFPTYPHSSAARIGVLMTNLGTPSAPTAQALRPYLKQFLSDPRVVEFPRLLWKLILHLVILRIRPRRSAQAYAKVWSDQGSPLAVYTKAQCEALSRELKTRFGEELVIDWAMRYGEPAIGDKIQSMLEQGVQKLLVLPLYPQYSGSTTGSTFDAVAADFTQRRWLPELRFISNYHDNEHYIAALSASIEAHWASHGRQQKLIFSYHGVPLRYLHNGDPYHCMCHKTTRLVATKLGLSEDDYLTCFQSRFGREPWLEPYTDKTLIALAKRGLTSVSVICPGFSADCLETLEEIDQENRDYFLANGGNDFHYIPALNASKAHIAALTEICARNLHDWWSTEPGKDADHSTERRYNAHPYNRF